jgi:NAD(P)-dependent dehydrogenase (short-subunit alcohol dehydrogenase family)
MDISQTISVVTGAGSGMGAETARQLARSGSKVILLDQNFEAATKVAAEIKGIAIACNVSNAQEVENSILRIQAQGDIRICINCAGIAPAKRIVGKEGPMTLEDFESVISVNLIGTFNVMRCVASAMMKLNPINHDGERGVIINTASIAAFEGQVGQAAYSASKGGIVALTLPAAREFARFGIRVMTIAPGIVETPMMLNMPPNVQQGLLENVPFPQRFAKPSEYAELVKHIIQNPMLNGSVIRLDGALRMCAK